MMDFVVEEANRYRPAKGTAYIPDLRYLLDQERMSGLTRSSFSFVDGLAFDNIFQVSFIATKSTFLNVALKATTSTIYQFMPGKNISRERVDI